ncbi:hypothetical protein AMS68_007176 [Peltaster fructicola]|uniref:Nuclear architecture-related protein 1 n=1 Tax=Peltaster fructicola TaxID=286661 RepID=A0A6H0Y485_9PEZI|nr:hypothetical protein AMS68_007176 [Peltaster fructicola]
MSAILSADDLNDFISPGVACIKPVETLPKQQPPEEVLNPYEVTTEEKVASSQPPPPAQISLTDCLACSGCVTSAEAVLVSLQSHGEVLDTLEKFSSFDVTALTNNASNHTIADGQRIFVASVAPQVRASLAATYNVTERQAGNMISQLLQGAYGLRTGGQHGSAFSWIIDTSAVREMCLVASADEVNHSLDASPKKPILTSACPGWICYAEKTHPHVLPHLSRLKSPQALTGTLVKSILAKRYGIPPQNVWHLAVMPCFDKKLEGARAELTSHAWHGQQEDAVRDVDCVITARELLMLAESRNISFPCLPKIPVSQHFAPAFPDREVQKMLSRHKRRQHKETAAAVGTSGGFLHHVLKTQQASSPGSEIILRAGRNADVSDYVLVDANGKEIFRAARYYGFRNIQNLVRRLKPPKVSRIAGAARKPGARRNESTEYAYVEVMACPGGCTNGGGQIKVGDVATLRQVGGTGIVNGGDQIMLPAQKDWLAKVDEAYWSASEDEGETSPVDSGFDSDTEMMDAPEASSSVVDGIDHDAYNMFMQHWANVTDIDLEKLIYTTYRAVESDVGKSKTTDVERVAGLAVQIGGGW